ncbi:MAG: MetQ/NlpA family ABC transporter substrate-binding protein [Clostridia bacterium]|nr:MetQ/NlpA family ABC transporter substrate-binding protein [Clostridia bacterium]
MKKLIALSLALLLCLGCLVSCGTDKDDKTVTVAASATPHAEILEQCVEAMAAKGYTLEIKVMDDYVIPNTSTEDGEVDANYFQHILYLNDFNAKRGTHLVQVAKVHYEPFAIYAGTVDSLDALEDGAKIAVPNDATNEARALLLLEANGLITLKEGVGLNATKKDIVENPHNYEIVELEASLIPRNLTEVAVAVINGNYALQANLSVANSLAKEASDSAVVQDYYANVLVVKEGNEDNEGIKALIEVLKSDAIKGYIESTYNSSVVFID